MNKVEERLTKNKKVIRGGKKKKNKTNWGSVSANPATKGPALFFSKSRQRKGNRKKMSSGTKKIVRIV